MSSKTHLQPSARASLRLAREMLRPFGWDVRWQDGSKHARIVASRNGVIEFTSFTRGDGDPSIGIWFTRQWARRLLRKYGDRT